MGEPGDHHPDRIWLGPPYYAAPVLNNEVILEGIIMNKNVSKKPALVTDLEIVYWPPSQEALGSAVFSEVMKDSDLDEASVEKYKYFVDKFWEQYGDEAWMALGKRSISGRIIAGQEVKVSKTSMKYRGSQHMLTITKREKMR